MNMNLLKFTTQSTTMTSREIAELSGKPHADLMKAIRIMEEAWVNIGQPKFGETYYIDAKGEKRPQYELSKTECLYIATKLNDEVRAKLILRWEALENSKSIQNLSRKEIAFMLIQSEEEIERLEEIRKHQEQLIETALPKVLFADCVTASSDTILIGQLAKILRQNGIETGQNRLYAKLRDMGILGSRGSYYNIPSQYAMEQGWFELKETSILRSDGSIHIQITTKVTGKGQIHFVNHFKTNKP